MYGIDWKEDRFEIISKKLRRIAKLLGIAPARYEIRKSFGGCGVTGEAVLHAYDPIRERGLYMIWKLDDMSIMYRTCKGMMDYTGGSNRFTRFVTPDPIVRSIKQMAEWRT